MGRSPCCEKVGLKKGPWTPEEDKKLLAYIEEHGHGSWRALPIKAGLQRCGKSCRLRWTNYLRPDIKRGKFSLQEEQTIMQLHALLGNRWSAIATHLPKRTDNEIKNHWNTHLKKRLTKMGLDPVTHKPNPDASISADGQSGNSADLNHMAQWERARLEAETRLAQESKMRSPSSTPPTPAPTQPPQQQLLSPQQLSHDSSARVTTSVSTSLSTSAKLLNRMATQAAKKVLSQQPFSGSTTETSTTTATASRPSWLSSAQLLNKMATQPAAKALCIEVLRAWQGAKSNSTLSGSILELGSPHGLESRSPTSTLNFHEISIPNSYVGFSENSTTEIEAVAENLSNFEGEKEGSSKSFHHDDVWKNYEKCLDDVEFAIDDQWSFESLKVMDEQQEPVLNFDGFTDLLLGDSDIGQDHSFLIGDSDLDQDHPFTDGDNNADGVCGYDYDQDDNPFTGGDREFNNTNGIGGDDHDQDKNYWNNIFDLVIASPSESPVF